MKVMKLIPSLVMAIISSSCQDQQSTEGSSLVEQSGSGSSSSSTSTNSAPSESSDQTSSDSGSDSSTDSSSSGSVYGSVSELQAAMEAQNMTSGGLQVGSYIKRIYPNEKKYRLLSANSVSDPSVSYEREIYKYNYSFGLNTSGSFWSGNLNVSLGSSGWEQISSESDLVTTKDEAIARIFSEFGTCSFASGSKELSFLGSTYQGYYLRCSNSSGIAYLTVIPELPLWANPVQQLVCSSNGIVCKTNSLKTYYVFEYNP